MYFYAVVVPPSFRTTVGAPFIYTIFSEFPLLPPSGYCYSCLRAFITFPFSKTNSYNLDQTRLFLNPSAGSQWVYYRTFKLAPFFRKHNLSSFMITFYIIRRHSLPEFETSLLNTYNKGIRFNKFRC
jgi:hypothetical protein